MFKHMKIGVRLGFAFGLALILMLLVVAVGLTRMEKIDERLETIVTVNMVKSSLINEMRTDARDTAIAARDCLLLPDMAQKQEQAQRIKRNRVKFKTALQKLEPLVTSSQGKKLLANLDMAKNANAPLVNQTVQLCLAGKTQQAFVILTQQAKATQAALLGALEALNHQQATDNDHDAARARQEYASARSLMIGIGAAALVLGVIMTFWITLSITRPLNEAVGAANRLAEGDLSVRIDATSRDETGQLLNAMKNMVEKLSQIITEVRSAADNRSSAS